jgi:hypothetical protein
MLMNVVIIISCVYLMNVAVGCFPSCIICGLLSWLCMPAANKIYVCALHVRQSYLPPTNNLLNQKANQASGAFTMPTTNQQPAKPKNQPGILGLYNAYHQPTTCKTKKPTTHLGPLQCLPPTNNLLNQKTTRHLGPLQFLPPTNNLLNQTKNLYLGLYNS